jgi:uncharacterized surface protein with fasciclin (FAS1) repeats
MKIKIAAAGSVAALLFLSGCAGASDEMTPEASTAETTSASMAPSESMSETMSEAPMEEPGTIVDVAAGNPDFETLVAAVTAADLVETLSGDGPFTVFAPTDDAFDALPEGLVDALLLPENKDALTSILTYHVVSGEVMAADVTAGDVATVEGSTIAITTDGGVMVNEANVVTTDVDASNGVIHVIDAVIVPPTVDVTALLG